MSSEKFSNSSVSPHQTSILFDIRTMFYLMMPSETYYEKAEEVPDLIKNVNII